MELQGASILIAGGTGGLGRRLAEQLGRHGARITIAARSIDPADHPEAATVAADLRLPSECERAVEAAVAAYGRLDAVINAAGVVAFGSLEETSVDTVEDLFMSNTFLPIFLTKAALEHMGEGGAIVTISGVVAEHPMAGMAAYSASKAASAAFSTAIRRELRRRKITVIDARPGHTETGLADRPIAGTAPAFNQGHDPDTVVKRLIQAIESDETDLPASAF
ncbi:MAG: SDR family oxidoreductase [Acidimicrobiia bacterium]|nr:SDR family oxidoreductase [Acidimicrobiia bacterium]